MKKIRGHPNYGINEAGVIYNLKWGRYINPFQVNKNSQHVAVELDGKRCYVHTLVLTSFVGPRPKGLECRHLDGNPRNNNLTNLCWGTRSENQRDSVRHGTHVMVDNSGEYNGMAKLSCIDIVHIRQQYKQGDLQKDLAKDFGVTHSCISNIVNCKSWRNVC